MGQEEQEEEQEEDLCTGGWAVVVDLQGLYCPLCKTKTTVLLWLVVVVVGQSEDESRRTDLSQRPF